MTLLNYIQDDTNISNDEIQNSLLLDTNVILNILNDFSLFNGQESQIHLKMAALTCDYFLITEDTIRELYPISNRFGRKSNVQKERERKFQRLAEEGNIRLLNKFSIHNLQDPELIQKHRMAIDFHSGKSHRFQSASINDITQILTAHSLAIPFFTEDRLLKKIYEENFGEPVYNYQIPFPFDSNELKDMSLNEIITLGKPFKKIYKKSFSEIKESSIKIHDLKNDVIEKNSVILEQQKSLTAITSDFDRQKEKIGLWKEFARPQLGEALMWTGIDTALSLYSIPFPTSPISYIMQSIRYKKMEDTLKDD